MNNIIHHYKGFIHYCEGTQIFNWPALFEPMDYYGEDQEGIQDQIMAMVMGWA